MKTNAKTLIAAIAAVAMSGSALAADLGKDGGIADLEERVAELESTTARKGNRKVSLTVSGYVSHSVMAWDDGAQSNVYIGDGGAWSSRFRFTGTAKVSPDVEAGFVYELQAINNALGKMNQGTGGDDLGSEVSVRQSVVYLRHKALGMAKIGHGSTATDDLILIDLSGTVGIVGTPDIALFNGAFGIRSGGALTGLTWGQAINGGTSFDTTRRNHVLYETPSLAGFTASAAVGENEFWDIALRYAGEFGGIRLAGGVGYSVDKESPTWLAGGYPVAFPTIPSVEMKDLKGSASVMHVNSGLFLTAAAGRREVNLGFPGLVDVKDGTFWHVMGGIKKNWFGIGGTGLYAEYQEAKDFLGLNILSGAAATTSTVNMWGFGITQTIDAAQMDLYLAYKNYSGDASLAVGGTTVGSVKADDFSAVIGGARISF